MRFILYPQNFINQNVICPFIQIDKSNYIEHLSLVKECIDLFNAEIKWDGMYTLDDAIQRFETGYSNFVLISDGIIYGYIWSIWETGILFFENMFMRKFKINKKWKGREFLSSIINTHYNNCEICYYVDSWNIASIKMTKSLGFVEKEFDISE
jgi:hypothetical protein